MPGYVVYKDHIFLLSIRIAKAVIGLSNSDNVHKLIFPTV